MNEWINKEMNAKVHEWIEWMNGLGMNEWMNE